MANEIEPRQYAATIARAVCMAGRFYRIGPVMDAIVIRDLRVDCIIGIHRRERHVLQTVSIDLEIGVPGSAVFASDKVADTIDYEQVALRIRALASSGHFRLVETFRSEERRVG